MFVHCKCLFHRPYAAQRSLCLPVGLHLRSDQVRLCSLLLAYQYTYFASFLKLSIALVGSFQIVPNTATPSKPISKAFWTLSVLIPPMAIIFIDAFSSVIPMSFQKPDMYPVLEILSKTGPINV